MAAIKQERSETRGDRNMKRTAAWIMLLTVVLLTGFSQAETVSGIRELFQNPATTSTPAPNAFRFRDGIRWGMNTQQVKALEPTPMTERLLQNWSIMLTNGKVTVSRFAADLVFMFHDDRLQMISYEFQNCSTDDYQYLGGALSTVYGEKQDAEPLKIKALMDAINPNRYRTDMISQAAVWITADGTSIYLYYFSQDAFAVMYVSPELGSRIYQTNGL